MKKLLFVALIAGLASLSFDSDGKEEGERPPYAGRCEASAG